MMRDVRALSNRCCERFALAISTYISTLWSDVGPRTNRFVVIADCCRRVDRCRACQACARSDGKSCAYRYHYHPDTGRAFRRTAKTRETELDWRVPRSHPDDLQKSRAACAQSWRLNRRWVHRGGSTG